MVALNRMAGNRAAAQLLRTPVDTQVPEGVDTGPRPLPAGASVGDYDPAQIKEDPGLGGGWTDADGTTTPSRRIGGIDRILLEGLSGHQGAKSWGAGAKAKDGYAAAAGPSGKQRGRAVALVPHAMKRQGGPITVVVHLHGIDAFGYTGSSGMRAGGAATEDIKDFRIPQQLESFAKNHPDSRVVVLMPLGATLKGSGGYTVDFGIDNYDKFVDESLGKLGITTSGDAPGSVYLSAHSGGGITISALSKHPFHKYRFGGIFAFESFHAFDLEKWRGLAQDHLSEDLAELQRLRADGHGEQEIAAAQASFLRDQGFRLVAFGGFGGYAGRVRSLRSAILDWFANHHRELIAATGGKPEIIDLLWRNYQASYAKEDHMAALSKDNHFESALESLVGSGAPAAATSPPASGSSASPAPTKPQPKPAAPPTAKKRRPRARHKPTTTSSAGHVHHKQAAEDEHKGEPPPPKKKAKAEEPAAAPTSAGDAAPSGAVPGQKQFEYVKWGLTDDPIEVIKKDQGHLRSAYGVPSQFLNEILEKAGIKQPDNWWSHFVKGMTFLGQPISPPIHEHLASHLRTVEAELAEKFGGPNKDPKVAGDNLHLNVNEDIKGSRKVSATAAVSMHMFGLAVDMNYTHNPYLLSRGAPPQDVFERAGQLVKGDQLKKGDKVSYKFGMYKDINAEYQMVSDANAVIVEYFSLADPANDQQLTDKLNHATGKWKKLDAAAARKLIEKDVVRFAGKLARSSHKEMIRKGGFLELNEALIKGLKLNWGAWYGDIMHFDMRTDGDIGQNIADQVGVYLAKMKKQADAPDPSG